MAAQYYYCFIIYENWFVCSFLAKVFGIRFNNRGEENVGFI